jgi:SAM-dependent methyltransferase
MQVGIVMVMQAMAACCAAFMAWIWFRMRQDHDDDDEIYYACFKPSASPVATPHAFVKIMQRLPVGSRIMDLGVGSGTYLEHELVRDTLRSRKLRVDGVDISAPNVAICIDRIRKHGLQEHFTAIVADARTLKEDGVYDAILFMESFPCMSKPLFVDILRSVQRLLKPSGCNYLYHNLADPAKMGPLTMAVARTLKPMIKIFIGIDFGRLTSIPEFEGLLADALPDAASNRKDEILLSCSTRDMRIDLSGVTNWFHRLNASVAKAFLVAGDQQMEQHLVTMPKGKVPPP